MSDCIRCGRVLATDEDFDRAEAVESIHGEHSPEYAPFRAMCWANYGDCTGEARDWPAEVASLRAEVARLTAEVAARPAITREDAALVNGVVAFQDDPARPPHVAINAARRIDAALRAHAKEPKR